MNGKRKRVYLKPESKVIQVSVEHLLQAVSGQHKHIGQGGTYGDAKRSNVEWDEWDDENQNGPTVADEDNE
nr:hypothetical protein [uncultured Prevotella sp.]